ncbi:hypothetical protein ACU3L3_07190 [Priestia endophytica]
MINPLEEILKWKYVRVTPSTLFKKQSYISLNDDFERWRKALDEGWRYDIWLNKFYRAVKFE